MAVTLPSHHRHITVTFASQVMADLTGMRQGAVEELVPPRAADPRHTLRALVPLAHLLGYASSVRARELRA